ncbi:MAG TPA: FecR domain-containing protein [Blastocatellia bacterium]|nr:FecR domain-containing protein [Blastocatellia bacterium]
MITKRISLAIVVSFLLASASGVTAKAQYLISTKAGFVNRVEGQVYIFRADAEDGEKARASLGSQMRAGDRLSVEDKGFAETLLNPGSYLRLSENAEVRAVSIDLDAVRFELIKGSVIAEIGQIDKKTPIEIITPHGALTIAKSGLYRIDAKEKSTLVAVRQGEIHLGTRDDFVAKQSLKIKRGKVVTLSGAVRPGESDIAKLNEDAIDEFDAWSFNRAQALTAANVRAVSRTGALTSGWYYDPSYNFYTFVPTRSWFSSPYGFGFFNNYRDCYGYTPYYYGGNYYHRPPVIARGAGSSPGVSPRVSPRIPPRVVSGNDRRGVGRATDRRIQMSEGGFGQGGFGRRSGGFGDAGRSRGHGSSPSASSPRGSSSPGGFSRGSGSPSPRTPRASGGGAGPRARVQR